MNRTIKKTAYFLLLTLSASLLFGCGGGTTTSGSAFDSSHGGYYEVYGNVEVCVGSYCDSGSVSGLVVHVSTTGRVTDTADFAPYCSSSNESQSNTWNTATITGTSTCSLSGINFSLSCYQTYNFPALVVTEVCTGDYQGTLISGNNVLNLRRV
jgi:hypothetical protein